MVSLLEVAARSCAKAAGYIMGRVIDRQRLERMVSESKTLTSATVADQFLAGLPRDSAVRFQRFLTSAEFEQLAFHTVAWLVGGGKDERGADLRELVRQSLRHAVGLRSDQLTIATDLVMDALVRSGQPVTKDINQRGDRHSVAVAADAAAAATRGGELLSRLRSRSTVEDFAAMLREQSRAVHATMRLIHVGRRLSVPASALYVEQTLADGGYPRATVGEVLARRLRPVVLGDPGGGKSTVAAALAVQVNSSDPADRVALVFSVRDHLVALSEHQTFAAYLDAVCRNPYNVAPPADALEYLLLTGRLVVIVDGFDEIGSGADRRRFATLLESFGHRYPAAQVVVTSRDVGYEAAALDSALFQPVRLAGFTEQQVVEYVARWFALDGVEHPAEQDRVTAFLHETRSLREIRANPLTLALLCGLSSSGQLIPRNRAEVYERWAALLFDEWDRLRGLHTPYRLTGQIRSAVANLAWHLLTSDPAHPVLARENIHAFLTEYMRPRFATVEEAAEEVDRFLDFCAGRAWMLSEIGTDRLGPVYGFTHRTFLEYFAAVQLVRSAMSPDGVWEFLRDKFGHPTWNVVAQLAVHILERNTEGGATRFLESLLADGEPADSPRTELAAACLDSVAPSYAVIAEVCRRATVDAVRESPARRLVFDVHYQESEGGSTDRALGLLLGVTSQDTREQVTAALADALDALARKPPDKHAGMLWALMATDDTTAVGELPLMPDVGRALRRQPIPPSAARFMDALTTRGSGESWLLVLFGSLGLNGVRYPALSTRLLSMLGGTDQPKAARKLRQLPLAAVRMPWIILVYSQDLEGPALADEIGLVAAKATRDILMSLDVEARGAALLLLLPHFEAWQWDDVHLSRKPRQRWPGGLGQLIDARTDPTLRPAATELLKSLKLHDDVNTVVAAWLSGKDVIEVQE